MIGGKVASFDDKETKKIPGVSYVGKIGETLRLPWLPTASGAAMEGRRVLQVTWDEGPNKDLNTAAIMDSLRQALQRRKACRFTRRVM